MNELSRKGLDAYYAEAASWNRDRVQALRSSRRVSWWIAAVAAAIALLEAVALVVLMPLKRVEPYTLMVDRTTGFVQALKPLDPASVAPDTALTQSFLVQYVSAREGFDIATLNADYRKVALLSSGAARSTYVSAMQASNPASPLALYPRSTVLDVKVKSVSPLGPDSALVRFDIVRSDSGVQPRPGLPYVAVLRYRYSSEPMKLEDRFINPLGFQVVSYRRDAEAIGAAPAEPVPDGAAAGTQVAAAPPYYAARAAAAER
jgi:type IV secretion system protein VirB8